MEARPNILQTGSTKTHTALEIRDTDCGMKSSVLTVAVLPDD